jgi:hypothetical protein
MRRLTVTLISLLMVLLLAAPATFGQERHRSKFGRKARTAAMIGGGTGGYLTKRHYARKRRY